MSAVLNLISVTSAFLFAVGIIYCIFDLTIGKIKIFNSSFIWHGLQIKDFIFLFISIILIFKFTNFYRPY